MNPKLKDKSDLHREHKKPYQLLDKYLKFFIGPGYYYFYYYS